MPELADTGTTLPRDRVCSPEHDEPPSGSVDAFLRYPSAEALYRTSYKRLVRTLAVIAGDRLRAEDALQDAFAELCLHWRKVGAYEDPEAWVRKVAINRLRNQERSLLRRSRALLRLGVWEAAKASAVQTGDDLRLRPELRAALLQLPLRQRAAVVLFYVEDLAVADVARCMDITEGAVNRHLHRGRETLRRLLEVRA